MNEFATWSYLLTSAGAVAFTLLIVQFIKPFGFLRSIDTRIIVFVVANILLQGASFAMQQPLNEHLLLILNSFVVSLAAMGAYQETFKPLDDAKKLASGE